MTKSLLVAMTLALLPPSLFAVDGVVLINQSTVMAAGGFPYVISQPGSYKLSGSLTMITTPAGNYAPLAADVAIVITHSGVVLDLNGFSIAVTNTNNTLSHPWVAITDDGSCSPTDILHCSYEQIVIRNGVISLRSNTDNGSPMGFAAGINLSGSASNLLEDLAVSMRGGTLGNTVLHVTADAMRIGPESVIRHNVLYGFLRPTCPSVVTENATLDFSSGFPAGPTGACTTFANVRKGPDAETFAASLMHFKRAS
jgi:hypothetical protein